MSASASAGGASVPIGTGRRRDLVRPGLIREAARRHADLIREAVDGLTGEDPRD